jgi:hypothetical protein
LLQQNGGRVFSRPGNEVEDRDQCDGNRRHCAAGKKRMPGRPGVPCGTPKGGGAEKAPPPCGDLG